MKIYKNNEVYVNCEDFILGGFYVEDDEDVKLTVTLVEHYASERLRDMINKQVDDLIELSSQEGNKTPVTRGEALQSISEDVENYLGITPETDDDLESIIDTVMESTGMIRWLFDMKTRINKFSGPPPTDYSDDFSDEDIADWVDSTNHLEYFETLAMY